MNEIRVEILNSILSSYTVNLKKNNLKLSLLNSVFQMNDLELYQFSLFQHDLPFIIEKGIIRNISAHIPWTSFFTDPVILDIHDIQISLSTLIWENSKMPKKETLEEIREHRLSSHEQFKSQAKLLLKIISPKFLKSMLLKIVGSMKINIERINIRINFGEFCLGIKINKMKIDDPLSKTDDIIRNVHIEGISVYIDQNQKDQLQVGELPLFVQQMNNYFNMDHEYIIKDLSCAGTALIADRLMLNLNICEINIFAKEWQIEFLLRVISCIPKFYDKLQINNLENPINVYFKERSNDSCEIEDDVMQQLWSFVHKAAIKINHNIDLLEKIKQYKFYINNYKNHENRIEGIIKLDHQLDYYTIILYRHIATAINGKWSKSSHLSIDQLNYCFGFCDYDGQVFIPNLFTTTPIKISIEQINMFIDSFLIVVCQPSFSLDYKLSTIECNIDFSSFQIKQKIHGLYKPVFESIESNQNGFSAKVLFTKKESGYHNELKFSINATDFTLNLQFLETVKLDPTIFSLLKRILLITKAYKFPFDIISMFSSKFSIVIHSGGNVHLIFSSDGFNLLFTRESTQLSLNSGRITFGDDKEILLAENINLNGIFKEGKLLVSMNPPSIFCDIVEIPKLLSLIPKSTLLQNIPFKEIVELKDLIPSFSIEFQIPPFDINVKVPLTSQIAKAHVNEIKLSSIINEIPKLGDRGLVHFNFTFGGMSLDANLFDML